MGIAPGQWLHEEAVNTKPLTPLYVLTNIPCLHVMQIIVPVRAILSTAHLQLL